jgi:two-component sensor histidine kinase
LIAISARRCGSQPTLEQTRTTLVDLEDRLFAHASLHRLLSTAPDASLFEDHCVAICCDLIRMFGRDDLTVHVQMEEADLGADQLFLLSLLVAELVTNVLKHSLVREQGGTIRIDMRHTRLREVELTVGDSRKASWNSELKGQPRIVNALVRTLSGKLDISCGDGYVTRVRVPLAAEIHEVLMAVNAN